MRSWRWAKVCPKHVELILEISKLLLLHLVGFYITLPTLMMHGQTQIKFSLSVCISVKCFESLCLAVSVGWAKYILSEVCDVGTPRELSQLGAPVAARVLGRCLDERSVSVPWWSVSDLSTVRYARTNVIGSRTSFVIASFHSSIHWNICIYV